MAKRGTPAAKLHALRIQLETRLQVDESGESRSQPSSPTAGMQPPAARSLRALARLTRATAAGGSGHRNRASLALVAYAVKLSEMQLLFALKRINGCVRASNAHTGPPAL